VTSLLELKNEMKIISWNCQGAFKKKNDLVLRLNPDLVIVTECEDPQRLRFGELTPTPLSYHWYGSNQNKGIAILSYSDYKVEVLDTFNPAFRYVIPIRCESGTNSFLLFAIWAMEDKDNRRRSYVGQIWEAINYYAHLLNGDTILVGDFNSNSIWDLKSRVGNHSDVVQFLNDRGIFSIYHQLRNETHGKETMPTFFLQRNEDKPYHIDYCFLSQRMLSDAAKIEVGTFADWIDSSDHVPLVVNIDLPFSND
jgi:endonuclease/exonuclease/phosphatase family metal-dependent hydrolase